MKKRKRSLGTALLMAALFLGVAGYFAIQGFHYLDDPLTITLAYRYEVETTVELTGFVVREERVLDDDSAGLLRIQRAEGERVAAGGTVAAVYADQASLDRQAEIESLEDRVEQLQYAQDLALAAETTRKRADRPFDAESTALELRALVLKRDYSDAGSGDIALQLQDLGAQLLALRAQAEGSVRRITAPEAGLYSAEVGGFESVLTPALLDSVTPSQLSALTADPSLSSRVGKLVLGDMWWYAAAVSVEDAMALQERERSLRSGEALQLRFSKGVDQDLPVEIQSVGAREDGRVVVVLRGSAYLQDLTLLRQQRAEIVTGSISGLRVPREALRAERAFLDGEGGTASEPKTGVYCMVGREARFKPVEVVYSADSFVLVVPSPELDPSLDGDSKRIVRAGEQIVASARGLFDGKVLQ